MGFTVHDCIKIGYLLGYALIMFNALKQFLVRVLVLTMCVQGYPLTAMSAAMPMTPDCHMGDEQFSATTGVGAHCPACLTDDPQDGNLQVNGSHCQCPAVSSAIPTSTPFLASTRPASTDIPFAEQRFSNWIPQGLDRPPRHLPLA